MSDVQSTQKPKSVFEEIDKGVITGSGPQTAAPATSLDANTIGLLANVLQLMAAKEARELQKQESDLKANAQREAQRAKNARGQEYERISKQARCKHRKGGLAVKDSRLDYNVGTHTFPDGTVIISCLTCRAKWRKGDTTEYFLRKGRKISNHTHIGWREAVGMYNQSSNTATKSEIDPRILTPGVATQPREGSFEEFNQDNQIRDTDGKVVENFEL